MRRTLITVLFFSFALTFLSASNPQAEQKRMDSLKIILPTLTGDERFETYVKLHNLVYYYEKDVDYAIEFFEGYIDELQKKGESSESVGYAVTNLIAKLYNSGQSDEVIARAPDTMEYLYEHERWDLYCNVIWKYILSHTHKGELDKAMEIAMQFYERAKTIDYADALPYALQFIGILCNEQNRPQDSKSYFRQALEEAKKNPKVTDIRLHLYYYTTQNLINLSDMDEALVRFKEWDVDLLRMEKQEGQVSPAMYSNLYSNYMNFYANKKNIDSLEYYCNKIEELGLVDPGTKVNILTQRANIAAFRGDYEKEYEYLDEVAKIYENLGGLLYEHHASKIRLYSLIRLNRYEQTKVELDKMMALTDSMSKHSTNQRLDELRTIYEVDKIELQKERQRMMIIAIAAICILLIVFLTIYIIYSSRLRRKNLSLYRQIQERVTCERNVEMAVEQIPEQGLSREQKLFRELRKLLDAEKLFTTTNLDRGALAERLGTNRQYLADAVKEGSGMTLGAYLADLRLKYALELLTANRDLTLEAIAEETGYASYSPFFKAFIQKYGMSPSEYRKISMTKN